MYIYANQAFYAFLTSLACARDFCNYRQGPGQFKSHIAQLKLAACGGKKGKKERGAACGRTPRHALSFLWGGVGNRFGDF